MDIDFTSHELAVIRQALNSMKERGVSYNNWETLDRLRKALSDCEKVGATLHINVRSVL